MKTILLLLTVSFVNSAWADTIVEKVAENKQWVANKIDNHSAWTTSACNATTLSTDSSLEVYAEKLPSTDAYAEPTVQVLFAPQSEEIFTAEASTDNGKKWSLTRASIPADPNMFAFIAKVQDRAQIIERIKKDNSFSVKLKNLKGKVISTLKFSLSGSSKTVSSQFEVCKLSFDTL
jgi:hypothetical protein